MPTKADATAWIATLNTNQWIIESQLKGLSHAQTMLTPSFRANCMNWVVGHIAEHRDKMLQLIEQPSVMSPDEVAVYKTGSPEMKDDDPATPIETLVEYLNQAKEQLIIALSADDLSLLDQDANGKTRWQRLKGLQWHETYHIGQLELLRQLAGTDDAII